jgi:hypothetical protein
VVFDIDGLRFTKESIADVDVMEDVGGGGVEVSLALGGGVAVAEEMDVVDESDLVGGVDVIMVDVGGVVGDEDGGSGDGKEGDDEVVGSAGEVELVVGTGVLEAAVEDTEESPIVIVECSTPVLTVVNMLTETGSWSEENVSELGEVAELTVEVVDMEVVLCCAEASLKETIVLSEMMVMGMLYSKV